MNSGSLFSARRGPETLYFSSLSLGPGQVGGADWCACVHGRDYPQLSSTNGRHPVDTLQRPAEPLHLPGGYHEADTWVPGLDVMLGPGCGRLQWPDLGLDTPQKVLGLATGPGTVHGSELGPQVVLQQYSHVQQCLLQMLRQALGAGLSAAVVSRHGEVDVGLPGIITHTIAIRDHGPEEHDTVGLGRDLQGKGINTGSSPQPGRHTHIPSHWGSTVRPFASPSDCTALWKPSLTFSGGLICCLGPHPVSIQGLLLSGFRGDHMLYQE